MDLFTLGLSLPLLAGVPMQQPHRFCNWHPPLKTQYCSLNTAEPGNIRAVFAEKLPQTQSRTTAPAFGLFSI